MDRLWHSGECGGLPRDVPSSRGMMDSDEAIARISHQIVGCVEQAASCWCVAPAELFQMENTLPLQNNSLRNAPSLCRRLHAPYAMDLVRNAG